MKNNKLTLKSLQQELERIKQKQILSPIPSTDSNQNSIKDSYIQRMYMRSGALWLYLITGILGYLHKIPFIGPIITLLSFWYGRTTIWKILSKIRKGFVILNALIGLYLVIKTTGFSSDNVLVGFVNMGHTYLEMLYNTTKRLFSWFVELFDHKIIPNVPGDTASGFNPSNLNPLFRKPVDHETFSGHKKSWDLANMEKDWLFKSPINITIDSTPWYKEWSTLLYIAGGVITIGGLYFGYKFIMDPTFVQDWFGKNPTITNTKATPPTDPGIELTDARGVAGSSTGPGTLASGVKDFSRGIVNVMNKTVYNLNPLHWFASSKDLTAQFKSYMSIQSDAHHANYKYFPYTEHYPHDSWFKKLRIGLIGETKAELDYRQELRKHALGIPKELFDRGKDLVSPFLTPVNSPGILGLRPYGGIESLPGTPNLSPLATGLQNLPHVDPSLNASWNTHEIDKTIDPAVGLRIWKAKQAASHIKPEGVSQASVDVELDVTKEAIKSYNKYELLDEEII